MKIKFLIVLFASATICFSQVNTFYVQPIHTDIQYEAVQDSHLVVRNTATQLNKLFLFLGGTGNNTQQYQTISHFAGNVGFDVINLSYPNDVAAASLTNSSDDLAFDKYRQEVCYGTPLSSDVTVDTLNSIYTRTVKLLSYLDITYPTQNWNQYLKNPTTLDWSKITVGGHSQGSGHACYFGKFNNVERVIMFSGPNEYSNFYSNSANWIRTLGITPPNRHFAYESLLDEVIDFDHQLTCLEGLGLYPLYDTIYVDNSNPPYNHSHILYTTQSPGIVLLNHNVPVKNTAINNSVWEYLLTSPIITSVEDDSEEIHFQLYPNPTNSNVNIFTEENLSDKTYTIVNILGQIVSTGILASNPNSIDISAVPSGLYFIYIDHRILKIVKQ